MDRRLIAGVLGFLLAGCAMARSGMPLASKPAPVEMGTVDELPPLGDSVAKTYADRDAATRRAGQAPASSPIDDPPPAAKLPPGRPSPFSDRTSGPPRPQSPPSGRADAQDAAPRPAPFADRVPDGPRPQSSPRQPEPSTPPPDPPSPPADPASAPPPSPFAASAPPNGAPADPQVVPASATVAPAEPAEKKSMPAASNGKAATVGTEVITKRQVYAAMIEKRDKLGDPSQWNNAAFRMKVFEVTLNGLIDRTLLVQAAKKKIKDIKHFNDEIDKMWVDHELPPLLREYKVSNIHELKRKLAGMGRSLDQMRDDFRLSILAHDYLQVQIKDKLHAALPEMYEYYNENKDNYQRPAQVVWREIEVDIARCPSRAEAKARADAIVDRLRKGDDFARLARSASHGPTAKEGGRWETAPGGSANADINAALAALAPGQTSAVIEAPGGFHIVRLESRREAGIAPFPEVQDRIKEVILLEKRNKYAEELIASLRAKTVVVTMFDNPNYDPAAVRTGAGRTAPTRR